MHFWILSIALLNLAQAEDRLPSECKNVPQYDSVVRKYGVAPDYTKACREAVAAIARTWQNIRVAKSKAKQAASLGAGETQSGNLHDAAVLGEAGAQTAESYSQIAARAKNQFGLISENISKRMKQLEKESSMVLNNESVSPQLQAEFHGAASAALEDFKKLRGTADGLVTASSRVSGELLYESSQLNAHSRQNRDAANRLEGGNQPAPDKKGVSKNLLVGIGGAALITAGAVGGLYWVSQKAIKSADLAATARIAQGEKAANTIITNAEASAKRIITFATNSVNKIIANAEEAANQIYDRAKNDANKLIAELRAEIQATFQNLTEMGLKKLKSELEGMFEDLIARAKATGDTALEANLKKTWDSLNGQIASEIATRTSGTSTASSTATSTSTNTSTSSSTATDTRL